MASSVEALLTLGASVDLPDQNSNAPLHSAARSSSPRVIALLLDHGADRSIRSEFGTPKEVRPI